MIVSVSVGRPGYNKTGHVHSPRDLIMAVAFAPELHRSRSPPIFSGQNAKYSPDGKIRRDSRIPQFSQNLLRRRTRETDAMCAM